MALLYGKNYSKRELLSHVGDMSQIAGIKPIELVNGNERGVRALEFNTGGGLRFTVLTDRGFDIYDANFKGTSLCWHSPAGSVAPAFYDANEFNWLWSFPGGLMVTCGLSNAGIPQNENDESHGLHGRISNSPAKNVNFGTDWEDDEYILWATAEVHESRLFGPNLVLHRSIHTRMGESKIWIHDEVENQGFEEVPLMLLYHCNIGFPVIEKDAELLAVIENMEPFDKNAEKGIDNFDRFEDPTPHYSEQCFYIDHDVDEKGIVNVALVNRQYNGSQGIGVYLAYPKKECPYYTQWKMVGEGAYVVGMEPGNCYPEGRLSAKKREVLKTILPEEKETFHLEIGVLDSNNEIRSFESKLRGLD